MSKYRRKFFELFQRKYYNLLFLFLFFVANFFVLRFHSDCSENRGTESAGFPLHKETKSPMQTKSETRNKIQFEHAYVAYQQGNLLQAEMLCKEILQTVPLKTAEGFQSAYLLGVIEYQNSEFETAAKHLQQALTVNSEHPQLLNALGGVYIGQEKYEVAQPLLEKAVRLSPRFQDARTNLAICYRGLDQTSQAIRVLKESKQLGIDNANGAKLLAECLMDQSDYSEAENLLIEQLGREPEDWYALNLLGICTSKQENFTKACSYFERAQALSATNTAIELNLASAYQQAGNFEKAEVIY
ncbi:MAG: tetratricopeptide repeat protein, partial [Gammaproteobacteria bacterium]|nr:tetratricopeptide repeat protein [Gammaproteobacteria bacterium]